MSFLGALLILANSRSYWGKSSQFWGETWILQHGCTIFVYSAFKHCHIFYSLRSCICIECHPMPVTASNGFPCLKKTWGSTSKCFFFAANILNTRKNVKLEKSVSSLLGIASYMWETLVQVLNLILGVVKLGFSLLDFVLCVEILG